MKNNTTSEYFDFARELQWHRFYKNGKPVYKWELFWSGYKVKELTSINAPFEYFVIPEEQRYHYFN